MFDDDENEYQFDFFRHESFSEAIGLNLYEDDDRALNEKGKDDFMKINFNNNDYFAYHKKSYDVVRSMKFGTDFQRQRFLSMVRDYASRNNLNKFHKYYKGDILYLVEYDENIEEVVDSFRKQCQSIVSLIEK